MSTWKDAFERDAVTVAFPDWGPRDDDTIDIAMEYEPGGGCPTCGWERSTKIVVRVARRGVELPEHEYYDRDRTDRRRVSYEDDEAVDFWIKLMKVAS